MNNDSLSIHRSSTVTTCCRETRNRPCVEEATNIIMQAAGREEVPTVITNSIVLHCDEERKGFPGS